MIVSNNRRVLWYGVLKCWLPTLPRIVTVRRVMRKGRMNDVTGYHTLSATSAGGLAAQTRYRGLGWNGFDCLY